MNYLSTHRLRAGAIALLCGGVLSSCQSSLERIEDFEPDGSAAAIPKDIRLAKAPEGFTFESSRSIDLELRAVQPQGEAGTPNVGISVWTHDARGEAVELARGATNAEGLWRPTLSLPADRDSVTIRVHSAGYPDQHRFAVSGGRTARYTLGRVNANGRIVAGPVPANEPVTDTLGRRIRENLSARVAFNYLGAHDAKGRPNYLTTAAPLWAEALAFINKALPDSPVPVNHPEYLAANVNATIRFKEAGDLWVSFAHEGTGSLNSIGYFLYSLTNEPTKLNQIPTSQIIFPNLSYEGSGGGLKTGDRVFLGKVPANTGVAVFLIPNGWKPPLATVVDNPSTRYNIDRLNRTFTNAKNERHAVLLADNAHEFAILGFEDQNRPNGDQDFNDGILMIQAVPWSALDLSTAIAVTVPEPDRDLDGVQDALDLYPDDRERAFESYAPAKGAFGTVAYEDMWPRIGDYDFNDLVVDYNVTEVLNAQQLITDLKIDLKVRALGGSQNHGFAFQLPVPAAAVASVKGQHLVGGEYMQIAANGTEVGVSSAVIAAFTSGFGFFDIPKGGIVNTDPTKPALAPGTVQLVVSFTTPLERTLLGAAPYDAFMIRSQDRTREIHLAGFAPTSKADRTTFNTEADASDASVGKYYVDENNLPWAIHLPDQFSYPQERRRIDEVYLNFNEWAVYGGTSQEGWFRPDPGNVDPAAAF